MYAIFRGILRENITWILWTIGTTIRRKQEVTLVENLYKTAEGILQKISVWILEEIRGRILYGIPEVILKLIFNKKNFWRNLVIYSWRISIRSFWENSRMNSWKKDSVKITEGTLGGIHEQFPGVILLRKILLCPLRSLLFAIRI